MYEKGIGVRKDKYKAAEIYRKACDGGNGSGCYYSGVIYARGDGFPRNESLAVLLFSIGCELGNSDSCLSFSTRSEIDSSASKEKLTEEQSRVSCNENETESCCSLGLMYYTGDGVRKDNFRAIEYFKKSCDDGEALGCANLGVMYALGQGVRQNKSKALEIFGKACDLKNEQGCKNYAFLKNQGVR